MGSSYDAPFRTTDPDPGELQSSAARGAGRQPEKNVWGLIGATKEKRVPTVTENLQYWTDYDWSSSGNEWTVGYGGPDVAWEHVIFPRIRRLLPAAHILELAPGFGVWTHRLRWHAKRMTLVDLTPRCIESCKQQFGASGMSYHVNDGKSLAMVPDNSVDFVFSWHSLVHCQHEVMKTYVEQLAKKLKPGGAGMIHHSNFGEYLDPSTGQPTRENDQWRGEDMTADKFAQDCRRSGLQVVSQEVVPWGSDAQVDCFSMFRRPRVNEPPFQPAPGKFVNPIFWEHVRGSARIAEAYGSTLEGNGAKFMHRVLTGGLSLGAKSAIKRRFGLA